jgi:hypothetical protein
MPKKEEVILITDDEEEGADYDKDDDDYRTASEGSYDPQGLINIIRYSTMH